MCLHSFERLAAVNKYVDRLSSMSCEDLYLRRGCARGITNEPQGDCSLAGILVGAGPTLSVKIHGQTDKFMMQIRNISEMFSKVRCNLLTKTKVPFAKA